MNTFSERLLERAERLDSDLCVGIDPHPGRLPEPCRTELLSPEPKVVSQALQAWGGSVLEAVEPIALAVKPQVAFFERFGPPGFAAFASLCQRAREMAIPVLADVKRGDIGSTAEAYASAYLRPIANRPALADAVTVNPFFGEDGVRPFVDAAREQGGAVFVLVRTSNPSATRYQGATLTGDALTVAIAEDVATWNAAAGEESFGPVGAVVGATAPQELTELRRRMPGVWFLIPGLGAQGASAVDAARGFTPEGRGALINASRSICFPWGQSDPSALGDWVSAVRRSARQTRDAIREAKVQAKR